jgi:hypothetical protein
MNDNWLIVIGILGVGLFLLMPSLIARITGRKVHVRTRTGSFIAEPFKTNKERQKEDEQDKVVKELNEFCKEVALADILVNNRSSIDLLTMDMGFEFPDTNGRPMLTNRAMRIVDKGNVSKAITDYRNFKKQKDDGKIDDKIYNTKLVTLYNECS